MSANVGKIAGLAIAGVLLGFLAYGFVEVGLTALFRVFMGMPT